MKTVSPAKIFVAVEKICLDRLLRQRFALRRPCHPFDMRPPRGESRTLPFTVGSELARAVCQSASKLADLPYTESSGVFSRSLSVGAILRGGGTYDLLPLVYPERDKLLTPC